MYGPAGHGRVFRLDRQINTVPSGAPLATPLPGVRNSQPPTSTEQDSLSELVASVVSKREKNNHFLLITAISISMSKEEQRGWWRVWRTSLTRNG